MPKSQTQAEGGFLYVKAKWTFTILALPLNTSYPRKGSCWAKTVPSFLLPPWPVKTLKPSAGPGKRVLGDIGMTRSGSLHGLSNMETRNRRNKVARLPDTPSTPADPTPRPWLAPAVARGQRGRPGSRTQPNWDAKGLRISQRTENNGNNNNMNNHNRNGYRILVLQDEKVLEKDGADGRTTKWMYLTPLNCLLQRWFQQSVAC